MTTICREEDECREEYDLVRRSGKCTEDRRDLGYGWMGSALVGTESEGCLGRRSQAAWDVCWTAVGP
jgi:hypothetical protein